MSFTNVKTVASVADRADYMEFGVGDMKAEHLLEGTHRMAAMSCDAGTVADFVEAAEVRAELYGRQVQGLSYIQSWDTNDFDPANPEHTQLANDLGTELAHRMHPNSMSLVITHVDGKGTDGCGPHTHNHILTINHDEVTGLALSDYKMHWMVAKENDALMREVGLSVITPDPGQSITQGDYWAERRGELGSSFDQVLGDHIEEVLNDPATRDMDSFTASLAERGVSVVVEEFKTKKDGSTLDTHGITYKMMDETGEGRSPRIRRRKASKLSKAFTYDSLESRFEQQRAAVLEQQVAARLDAERVALHQQMEAAQAAEAQRVADEQAVEVVEEVLAEPVEQPVEVVDQRAVMDAMHEWREGRPEHKSLRDRAHERALDERKSESDRLHAVEINNREAQLITEADATYAEQRASLDPAHLDEFKREVIERKKEAEQRKNTRVSANEQALDDDAQAPRSKVSDRFTPNPDKLSGRVARGEHRRRPGDDDRGLGR